MNGARIITVPESADGQRLDRWLRTMCPGQSFAAIQKWLRTGQVRVAGHRAKGHERLATGVEVRLPPQAVSLDERPLQAPRELRPEEVVEVRSWVLHEDDELFVLNKPAGLAVQGGVRTRRHLDGLLDALRERGDERPRLVHRLDRDTSGVLVVARSARAATRLTGLFREGRVRKLYWAVVKGVPHPASGLIDASLAKRRTGGGRETMRVVEDAEGHSARTRYTILQRAGTLAAWLALEPLTGRTHQIRAHCAHLGTPILGDGKYGGRDAFLSGLPAAKRLHLHARAVRLSLARGKCLIVTAPVPDHMRATFQALGFEMADVAGTDFWPC
jgi:23S rRNA pseudouridine955/2504/2580 synthase